LRPVQAAARKVTVAATLMAGWVDRLSTQAKADDGKWVTRRPTSWPLGWSSPLLQE